MVMSLLLIRLSHEKDSSRCTCMYALCAYERVHLAADHRERSSLCHFFKRSRFSSSAGHLDA